MEDCVNSKKHCSFVVQNALVGFKKVLCKVKDKEGNIHDNKECIVTLTLPKDATVVKSSHHYTHSSTREISDGNTETFTYNHDYFKYRTDKAKVEYVTPAYDPNVDTIKAEKVLDAHSYRDESFKYVEGENVTLKQGEKLDTDDVRCSQGIHFFVNLKEAVYFDFTK